MLGLVILTMKRIGSFGAKAALRRDDGMGTVEIVIIIAVLVGLALIFRNAILDFAKGVMESLFSNDQIKSDVDVYNM